MSKEGRSHIRVDVAFDKPVVFAGEVLAVVITIRNTAIPRRIAGAAGASAGGAVGTGGGASVGRAASMREPSVRERVEDESDESGWGAGKRLSMQLSSAFRDMILSQVSQQGPGGGAARHRRGSSVADDGRVTPETLLMGYAQIQGYVEVDPAQVDVDKFAAARRGGHAIVGTRRGDVGAHLAHHNQSGAGGGLFRGFTSGLSGMLGAGDGERPKSGIMVGGTSPAAGSDDAMLLFSTPQTLLFADLKLGPGESRQFGYRLRLPDYLPPSCRGKVMSIHYNLVVGTQRLDAATGAPIPRTVAAPFRVFPFVGPDGSQVSHDVLQPVVLERDPATAETMSERKLSIKSFEHLRRRASGGAESAASAPYHSQAHTRDEFAEYVGRLLRLEADAPVDLKGLALGKRRSSSLASVAGAVPGGMSARDNVEYFVKYFRRLEGSTSASSAGAQARQLRTRFDVGANGRMILSLSLSRPVYRIGEEVLVFLDFSRSPVPSYHVTATLECTERVHASVVPGAATADNASEDGEPVEPKADKFVHRIYSQVSKSLFTTSKVSLEFAIPFTGTPQFFTSAVAVSWSLRLDFTVGAIEHSSTNNPASAATSPSSGLLEAHAADGDRGHIFSAKQSLQTDSFTCRIPLQVYPTNQDIGALLDRYASYVTRTFAL